MAQLNPMLEELQQQIEEYNKDIEKKIEEVAHRQNRITIIIILFNVAVFIGLAKLTEHSEPLISGIDNNILNLLITLALLAISFPSAAKYAKRGLQHLRLNDEPTKPSLNYAGSWEYNTDFRIQTQDDGSDEYNLLKANMECYKEHGISKWTQNKFELKIDFANTKKEENKAAVHWESNPISYDDNKLCWSFNGSIWWKDGKNDANEFSGIELYYVQAHDEQGRPSRLEGRLRGIVLIGEKFFALDAISSFERVKE